MQRRAVLLGWLLVTGAACGGSAGDGQRESAPLALTPGATRPEVSAPAAADDDDDAPPEEVPPTDDPVGSGDPVDPSAPAAGEDRDGAPSASASGAGRDDDRPPQTAYAQTRQRLLEILERNCSACHDDRVEANSISAGLQIGDDLDVLVAQGYIIPLSREESPLMRVMEDGSMPPRGTEPRPTPEEIELFGSYIEDPDYWPALL